MTRIQPITDEQAANDPVLTALFEGTRKLVGRVPNSVRVRAHLPRAVAWNMAVVTSLQREGGGGSLPGRLKEIIVLKTSILNQCTYCVTHNTALAEATGLSVEEIDSIDGDYLGSKLLSDREKAAARWAEAVTLNTAGRDEAAFQELKRHFSDSEIVEITWLAAYFNMANRMQDALQIDIEDREQVRLIKKGAVTSEAAILDYVREIVRVVDAQTPGSS
jgi:uncharacterized peroxidase-related enzyme